MSELHDHKGNVFKSFREMGDFWGVSGHSLLKKLRCDFWTLEDLLEIPRITARSSKICSDFNGNTFRSVNEMADFYDISVTGLVRLFIFGESPERIKSTLECLLQKKVERDCELNLKAEESELSHKRSSIAKIPVLCYRMLPWTEEEKRTDHKGIVYDSVGDMLKAYHVPANQYWVRLASGWSLKDMLEPPHNMSKRPKCIDHCGNVFDSVSEMARYWGKDGILHKRLEAEWSMQEALETPLHERRVKRKDVADHKGNVFDSVYALVEYYKIPMSVLKHRIKTGWSVENALETSVDSDV